MKSRHIVLSILLLLSLVLGACAPAPQPVAEEPAVAIDQPEVAPTEEVVTLKFTFWGSPVEKEAVETVARKFEESHPNIKINAIHIPEEYEAKLSTMVAGNEAPDLAYISDPILHPWYQYNRYVDMTPYYQDGTLKEPFNKDFFFYFEPGKTIGTPACAEMPLMFYNKDLFDQAGLPYPPSDPDEAWDWAQFLDVARKLTVDKNGKHPGEEGFDPENIEVYGTSISKWWGIYFAFFYSNDVKIVSDDGMKWNLDSPEGIEVVQALADLSNVDHVAPTPAQSQNLPGGSTLLQTGKLAMTMEGHWMLLDFNKMKEESGLNFGVAVLPMFKRPATETYCMPIAIFNSSNHKEEAMEFYKFLMDPVNNDLFAQGLWLPIYKEYYTDEEKIKIWTNNPAHPPEFSGIIEYALCCSHPAPGFNIKDLYTVYDNAIGPALDQVWSGERQAEEVLKEVIPEANKQMKGRWDK